MVLNQWCAKAVLYRSQGPTAHLFLFTCVTLSSMFSFFVDFLFPFVFIGLLLVNFDFHFMEFLFVLDRENINLDEWRGIGEEEEHQNILYESNF